MTTVYHNEDHTSGISTTTNSITIGAATTGSLGGSGTVLINGSASGVGGTYWGTYPSTTTTTTVTVPTIALKSDLEDLKETVLLLSKAVDDLNDKINYLVDNYLSTEEWENINSDSE